MSLGELNVGDTLRERFVLEKQLGAGGMGRVFKALDLIRQEACDREPYVAIKFVSDAFRNQPISFFALQREAKKAQKLTHPNIVRVFDFDRVGDVVFIVMEYLSGNSLEKVIRTPLNEGASPEDVLRILEPVCSALTFAHANGIIHLDIKPSNIFLTDDGSVKIIDFGIATAIRSPDDGDHETVFDPRRFGAMTSTYASPEIIDGLEPDPRDDVYSLAVVTYELLTGRHPFDRASSVRARAAKRQPARIKSLNAGQWAALQKALAFDRDKRTPSVAKFIDEFRRRSRKTARWKRTAAIAVPLLGVVIAASFAAHRYGLMSDITGDPMAGQLAPDEAPSGTGSDQPAADDAFFPRTPPPPPPREETTPETVDVTPRPDLGEVGAMASGLVAQAPCAALTSFLDEGALRLVGYVGDRRTADDLLASMKDIPGVGSIDTGQVQQVPERYCTALETYSTPARQNLTNNLGVSVRANPGYSDFIVGDELVLYLNGPSEATYLYVDYYSLDGFVSHMLPNALTASNRLAAGQERQLGAGDGGHWVIGAPAGVELIAVLASPVPLLVEERPEVEPAAAYLGDLRTAMAAIQRNGADPLQLAADLLFITTKEKP